MKPTEPQVTVLTPAYNGGQYLAQCIESVLAQTYPHWEYIIVNNCSTDATARIAEQYASRDPRVHVHHNRDFLNLADNWNHALRLIDPESRYCKIVHTDDWLFPRCLSDMVALAEANPSVGLVSAYIQEGNDVVGDGLSFPSPVLPGRRVGRDALMGDLPYLFGSPSALLIRADVIRGRDSFYNAHYRQMLDLSGCYHVLEVSDFGFVHQVLTFHRLHEQSQTAANAVLNRILSEHIEFLREYGPRFLTPEELARRIGERLRNYYHFLARAKLTKRDPAFWSFHRERLDQLGYPLNSGQLRYALLREMYHVAGEFVHFPLKTARKWRKEGIGRKTLFEDRL